LTIFSLHPFSCSLSQAPQLSGSLLRPGSTGRSFPLKLDCRQGRSNTSCFHNAFNPFLPSPISMYVKDQLFIHQLVTNDIRVPAD